MAIDQVSSSLPYQLVVMGASQGGVRALSRVLASLPDGFLLPIVIVQHFRTDESGPSALLVPLQTACALPVSEAHDKDIVSPGHVYLAPSGYHLLIEGHGLGLSRESPVHWTRPSITVLFESAAETYRARVIGVLLTGANPDGADGLAAIKRYGGLTIVQDPVTAEARVMPDAAIAKRVVDRILPLEAIGPFLVKTLAGSHEARRDQGRKSET